MSAKRHARRWLWRYPHRLLWRSLVWWRCTGESPRQQTLTGLVFFNPRALDRALVAGLKTKDPR